MFEGRGIMGLRHHRYHRGGGGTAVSSAVAGVGDADTRGECGHAADACCGGDGHPHVRDDE